MNFSIFVKGLVVAFAMSSLSAAAEDAYPTKPVKIILGLTPGASTDYLAREVAKGLGERLKVPVVVENRPGANTIIATQMVAKAPADGYTLYLTNIVSAINPWVYDKLPYDFKKDMKNIALLGYSDNLLAVSPKLNIKSGKELVDYARKNPGKLSYGSSGVGTIHNLLMELIAQKSSVEFNHIPYKGAAGAITDVLGGNLGGYFGTVSSQIEFVKRGELVPLFVTSAKRSHYMPDVPTLAEAGLPPLTGTYWMGLSGPAGMPDAVVTRLNKEVNGILTSPETVKRLNGQSIQVLGGSPAEMDKFYDEELQLWKAAAKAAKITPMRVQN